MQQEMTPPILITGCARSGTSLVGGIVNLCGAFGGVMHGPTPHNKKGMYENGAIQYGIVKQYLKQLGVDPRGQKPLPDIEKLHIPIDWKQRVESIMLKEGYKGGPWFYKEAKLCLHWPVWHYAFPTAKWLIVRRRSADIAESCLKTGFMNAYDTYEGWLEWIHHHEDRFYEMISEGLNVKVVWPERMVYGDYSQMREAIEWLGLDWDAQKVQAFIEPKLWKAKKKFNIK